MRLSIMRPLLAAFLALTLAACAQPSSEIEPDSADSVDTVTAPVSPSVEEKITFVTNAVALGGMMDRAMVVETLGVPHDERLEIRQSESAAGVMDTLTTLVYPGLTTTVATDQVSGGAYLLGITLTDPQVNTPHDVRVGDTIATVRSALGQPEVATADAEADALVYIVDESISSQPRLVVMASDDGERVEALRYSFFYD
jgi:hypothetical protein